MEIATVKVETAISMGVGVREVLEQLLAGRPLSRHEAERVFQRITAGEVDASALAGFLVALRAAGETPAEIAGGAAALLAAAEPFDTGGIRVVDTCGTGGDQAGTVNISTAVAFVVAELGLPVAKHGNRSVSSRCGSADLLAQCGVAIDASPEIGRHSLEQAGITFLFAPRYHPAMQYVMPARKALGIRTVFNVLGPLVNPARPTWHLLGVYSPRLCRPVAETLSLLGCPAALVVHGSGLDEIAVHGPTHAARLSDGSISELDFTPMTFGARQWPLSALTGADAEANAIWLKRLLDGRGEPAHIDAVAVNAGAVYWLSDRVPTLAAGYEAARDVLAGGGAARRLELLAELSHAEVPHGGPK